MKNKISHSVIVGIFITIGILILVSAIFVLGGQQKTFVKAITIKAVFDDINGLQAGNNVWLFGVKIGVVKKVNFYGQSRVEVIMSIEKEAESHIHKDGTAKIGSDGFIGNKIVVINGGTQNSPEIQEDDYIKMASVVGTDQVLSMLQQNNKNLLDITTNLKAVSKKLVDGEGSLGQLLSDNTMADDIKAAVANFKEVSERSEGVVANVQRFTAGLQKPGTLADEMVTDTIVFNTIRATVAHLDSASQNLNFATMKVYSVTDSIQKASEGFNDPNKPIGMLINNEAVAQDLRVMIKNLSSGSEKLNEDLEAVQHNFLLRGFFRKKEKAEKQ